MNKLQKRKVLEMLDELGYDPIGEMVALARDFMAPIEVRAKMAMELAGYAYPKLKAVEVSGPGGESLFAALSPVERAQRVASMVYDSLTIAPPTPHVVDDSPTVSVTD